MTEPQACGHIAELLDVFLDKELPASAMDAVSGHLAECPDCARELAARKLFRERLRSAARRAEAPANLTAAIDRRLRSHAHAFRRGPLMIAFAAAAMLTICVVAWQLARTHTSPASQDAYLQKVSASVARIMRVGLNDHVHCAVFRKYPAVPQPLDSMTALLGPKYADLEPVFAAHVPPGMKVVMAHQCSYRGRRYIHLIARDGGRLMSLVIARREEGEAFEGDLRAVASEAAMPIYSSGAEKFSIAGFETREHLVYLISDMSRQENIRTMEAMAAQVKSVLNRAETEG